MGFLNKFADEVAKKQASLETRARNEIRQKARSASDAELRHNLQRAIDNDNYIMQEEIEKEMERRGI